MNNHFRIAIVTSIHLDFDSRIWKHAVSLVDAGCEVFLICPWDVPNGKIIKGVRFLSFPREARRIFRPLSNPIRVLRRLLPLLKDVDIVHFHDLDILPWMTLISLIKPVIYDVHENYPEEMLQKDWIPRFFRIPLYHIVRWFQYFFSKIIRNIILVASSQEDQFRHPDFRIFYLFNFATLSLIAEAKDNYMQRPDTIICVGSGYESNGTLLILEIASLMKSIYPHIKFLLPDRFASTSFRNYFLQQKNNKGLDENVMVFPYILPHLLMSVLNEATIAIAPNLRVPKQEMAIPTKLFEYMAAGLPIVSSDLSYQRDLFSRHQIGLLAQPEDPGSFVRAIKALMDNRSLAYEMGKNGQQAFIAEYCWESQIHNLLTYYSSIINNRT